MTNDFKPGPPKTPAPSWLLLTFLWLACVGVAPAAAQTTLRATEGERIQLPSSGVRGIHWSGNRLWLLMTRNTGLSAPETSFEAQLMVLDKSTGAVSTVSTERDGYESGLAFDGSSLWSGGSLLGEREGLYQINPRSGRVIAALPGSGYHPAGLAWDGDYLWQVDADARKLYRMDVEEGRVSRKLKSPGFYPTGLAHDGFHFWCADASSGRLYRLRGTNGRVDAVVSREAFYRPGEFVSLAWDGKALWVVSASEATAVRLDLVQ